MAKKIKFNPDHPEFEDEAAGNTPFGIYDNDPQFLRDAPKVRDWVARRLGWPEVDIEINEEDIYAAFEEAVMEYSKLVNEYNIIDDLYSVIGQPTDQDLTAKYVNASRVPFMVKMSKDYGSEVGAGGDVHLRKDFIEIGPDPENLNIDMRRPYTQDGQTYDLVAYMKDKLGTERNVVIKEVYHHRPPKWSLYHYHDSFVTGFFGTNMAQAYGYDTSSYYLMYPVNETLLRTQALEFDDKIRRSHYSFELIGGRVKIHPVPKVKQRMWFEYMFEDELRGGSSEGQTPTVTNGVTDDEGALISDISNVPYENLPYFHLNDHAKRWILRYTLGISMHKLGVVRSKYSDIPSPIDNFSLDGDELRSEGEEMMQQLIDSLEETLEKLSRENMLERANQEANQLQNYLSKIPMKIYTG